MSDAVARDRLLDGLTPDVCTLTLAAERMAQRLVPDALMTYEGGDIGIGTDPGYRGLVFVITPLKDRVRLGIPYGADLDDSDALLKGGGRRHRYVVFVRAADLDSPGVSRLLLAAVDAARARHDATY